MRHFFSVSVPWLRVHWGFVGHGQEGREDGEKGRLGKTEAPEACSLSPVELRKRLKAS